VFAEKLPNICLPVINQWPSEDEPSARLIKSKHAKTEETEIRLRSRLSPVRRVKRLH
jgi:hypothetical protein